MIVLLTRLYNINFVCEIMKIRLRGIIFLSKIIGNYKAYIIIYELQLHITQYILYGCNNNKYYDAILIICLIHNLRYVNNVQNSKIVIIKVRLRNEFRAIGR